ncbi:queuosine precursor transporter [Arcanobacterium hippocoleae]|nr:queuosine precursor transporter [Arcanobacterium hippocoleae]
MRDVRKSLRGRRSMYDIFAVCFVAFLLLSNIGATKLIAVGPLVFDGGAILFPLTYIIGDVLSEVYGFRRARRAIFMGFAISIIASLVFWIIIQTPAVDLEYQKSFAAVLGVVPRFVAASLLGYIVGQLLNSYVLVWIKEKYGEKQMWARLIGSTVVGEFADTVIFCLVAWLGVESFGTILNLTIVGILYKVGVEVVLLPITYLVIRWVKRHEIEYK